MENLIKKRKTVLILAAIGMLIALSVFVVRIMDCVRYYQFVVLESWLMFNAGLTYTRIAGIVLIILSLAMIALFIVSLRVKKQKVFYTIIAVVLLLEIIITIMYVFVGLEYGTAYVVYLEACSVHIYTYIPLVALVPFSIAAFVVLIKKIRNEATFNDEYSINVDTMSDSVTEHPQSPARPQVKPPKAAQPAGASTKLDVALRIMGILILVLSISMFSFSLVDFIVENHYYGYEINIHIVNGFTVLNSGFGVKHYISLYNYATVISWLMIVMEVTMIAPLFIVSQTALRNKKASAIMIFAMASSALFLAVVYMILGFILRLSVIAYDGYYAYTYRVITYAYIPLILILPCCIATLVLFIKRLKVPNAVAVQPQRVEETYTQPEISYEEPVRYTEQPAEKRSFSLRKEDVIEEEPAEVKKPFSLRKDEVEQPTEVKKPFSLRKEDETEEPAEVKKPFSLRKDEVEEPAEIKKSFSLRKDDEVEQPTEVKKPFSLRKDDEPIAKPISSKPTVQPTPSISVADEIRKFKELLDIGAITQEEYDAKKKELLNL